ncbi:MAG: 3-hydroxyacyl-CoA dehydrogenase NAD-binding domain-containing protein [Planctomycetota bacterium]
MGSSFTFQELDDKIGLVTFDVPGQRVNTFSQGVIKDLGELVAELEKKKDLRGLLVTSGKPGQFIAGADLNELGALAYVPKEQFAKSCEHVHSLFTRFSHLPYPTVALIDGPSMGGGTEFALSMDYRLCSTSPKVQIGLPETKVGIIPGWGGTQRLPRLIGVHNALAIITAGDAVGPKKAAQLGLVFDAVPADKLIEEGKRLIDFAQKSGEWKETRKKREQPIGLSDDQFHFLFALFEGGVMAQTKGQYPAPMVALQCVKKGCNVPLQEGLKIEIDGIMQVAGTPISAAMIAVFFMNNRLSRDTGVDDASVKPRNINRVGVLGAGLMGAGIATAHARSGIPSAMVDVDDEKVNAGLARAQGVVAGRMKAGKATPEDMAKMLGCLSTSTSTKVFADCDLVVEAIIENEELKTKVYKELAGIMKPDAILASNTSTISITRMAQAAPNPERFAGMHFFNPVDRMALVEVIRGEKTSDETVATLVALAKRVKKTPIVVRDCPGFLVNRLLLPYMNEALIVLLEGASMDEIDKACTRFGMPMGPIALSDLVGLDTGMYAGNVVIKAFADRAATPPPLLADLVKAGRLGEKSGAGFRKFAGGKKGKPVADPDVAPFIEKYRLGNRKFTEQEIVDRLFLPMLVEATRILEENIVRDPSDVDMGLILGTGFPPFRGGLLRWADNEGIGKIMDRLAPYQSIGKRYEPTAMLQDMAKSGKQFYPRPKITETMGG